MYHHMKDHVQGCHLTKFDAFGVNRNEFIDLEAWFKIHINASVMLRQRPPTSYKLLIFFSGFCDDTLKNGIRDFHLNFLQMVTK